MGADGIALMQRVRAELNRDGFDPTEETIGRCARLAKRIQVAPDPRGGFLASLDNAPDFGTVGGDSPNAAREAFAYLLHSRNARRAGRAHGWVAVSARIFRWPSPEVWRLLDDLATIGRLALDAWALGDRDLLADCRRWHEQRCTALEAQRRTRGKEGAP